ncbi:transposable element Tcb2 transposase [Trichonephila clavipes]|nr:transposable element Tcb2 transposase [Trichonephila clavipes]
MVCVRLTSRRRRDCREWATRHVNWRRIEWSNVLFSDESRFSVRPDNRLIFIKRERDSRNNPAFVHESAGIVRMEWSVCSPDMNPIEPVWDALRRRVADRQPPPQTLQERERALLEEWDRISQLVIKSLIDPMPQRCSKLLVVRRNHTLYRK